MTLPMTEAQLQSAVIELARTLQWRVFHPYDSRRSEPGWPDLTLVRGKRLLFVELKAEKGRPSAEQKEWLQALNATTLPPDQHVYVWWPADWTDGTIEAVLR
jgi:hypothetical protein